MCVWEGGRKNKDGCGGLQLLVDFAVTCLILFLQLLYFTCDLKLFAPCVCVL